MNKLLIFGRGKYCKSKIESVKSQYDIIGFLDNSVDDDTYDEFYGYPVYSPEKIDQFDDCYIMCMANVYIEMWKQLIDLKIDPDRILFATHIRPFFSEAEKQLFGENQRLKAGTDYIIYSFRHKKEYHFSSTQEFKEMYRMIIREEYSEVEIISRLGTAPVSRNFGAERGKAVDRYYIENFLKKNSRYIQGTVMEIGDDAYTRKYGGNKVTKSIVLHVDGYGKNAIKGNFETGEGLEKNMVDCLICTQTLQYIYDLKTAVNNIKELLRPNATALITVPGIKSLCTPCQEKWGEWWSFTQESVERLFGNAFGKENCEVEVYGNAKTTTAYLYGMCCEDLKEEDFVYNDPQFPFLITACLKKNSL